MDLFQEQNFAFIDVLCFRIFYFIFLPSDLSFLLPSTCSGFSLLFSFSFTEVEDALLIRPPIFSIGIYGYYSAFLSENWQHFQK